MVRRIWCLAVGLTVVIFGATTSSARTRAAQPPPAFERVLMPFVGEGAVANQYWLSQFWARNESDTPIPIFFPYPCQLGEGCSPNSPGALVAHALFTDPTYRGTSGVFLNIGKGRLRDLAYTLRVEDVSGLNVAGVTLGGTELPLVPVDRFSSTVTLLNVPAGTGTLKLLRVYDWTGEPANVTVRIYSSEGNLLTTQTLALQAGATESGFEAYPAFGTVDLTSTITTLASQATQGRLNIEITADSGHQIWSFLALLQQGDRSFTAITPGR